MKNRIISIVLLLCMMLALSACGAPSTTDTGTDTGNTDTGSGSTNSDTSTGGGTYVPPILDHDTIKYEAKYADAKKTKIKYGTYSIKAPTVAKYYNNCSAALSMTFDDGADADAARLAESIMSQYGFKGTLFVNISNISRNLSEWQQIVAGDTFDIGSHGWDHIGPNSISSSQMEHEIKDSYDYLQQNFGYENPVTYATPLSQLTNAYKDYLIECGFISNRLETGGEMFSFDKETNDMFRIYAKRIDTKNNVETNVRNNIAPALDSGKWFVDLFHNVRVQDSTDISEQDFRNHCQWLYDNYNGEVWFGSYDDVAKYLIQRESTTVEYVDCDSESMTFVATVDKNYGQEMTLEIYLPFFIDSAYAEINGETQYLTLVKKPNTRIVYVNTEISEQGTEIKIHLGGNDKYFNNCQHNYVENEVVAPTADSYGYTEMVCTNEKCGHVYKAQYTNKIED